jgi:hypothetical protein
MNKEPPFPHVPRWHDSIPREVQKEIGQAVESQMKELPLYLQFEWYKPCYLERSFFLKASKYIRIPGSDYWQ